MRLSIPSFLAVKWPVLNHNFNIEPLDHVLMENSSCNGHDWRRLARIESAAQSYLSGRSLPIQCAITIFTLPSQIDSLKRARAEMESIENVNSRQRGCKRHKLDFLPVFGGPERVSVDAVGGTPNNPSETPVNAGDSPMAGPHSSVSGPTHKVESTVNQTHRNVKPALKANTARVGMLHVAAEEPTAFRESRYRTMRPLAPCGSVDSAPKTESNGIDGKPLPGNLIDPVNVDDKEPVKGALMSSFMVLPEETLAGKEEVQRPDEKWENVDMKATSSQIPRTSRRTPRPDALPNMFRGEPIQAAMRQHHHLVSLLQPDAQAYFSALFSAEVDTCSKSPRLSFTPERKVSVKRAKFEVLEIQQMLRASPSDRQTLPVQNTVLKSAIKRSSLGLPLDRTHVNSKDNGNLPCPMSSMGACIRPYCSQELQDERDVDLDLFWEETGSFLGSWKIEQDLWKPSSQSQHVLV